MNELVSVIIPVYNTAKYLDKCMESVVNQTYGSLQIILVEDGAKDQSPAMCDAWKKRDSRIEVIHKENEGLGLTRNVGLDAAKGRYVCFLDSDDTIELNTIETCVRVLDENRADACFYPRKTFDKEGNYSVSSNKPSKLIYEGKEVREEFSKIYWGQEPSDSTEPFLHSSVCRGMFLRAAIEENNLRFMSERICLSEDVIFGLEFCKHAQKIVIIPEYFYNYTYNETSLTKSYRPQRVEQSKNLYQLMEKQFDSYSCVKDAKIRAQHRYINNIQQCVEMEVKTHSMRGWKQTYSNLEKLVKDDFVQKVFGEFPIEEAGKKRKIFIELIKHKSCKMLLYFYLLK